MATERECGEKDGVVWRLEGECVAVKLPVKSGLYPDGITMRFKGSFTPGDIVTEGGVTTMLEGEMSAKTIKEGVEPDFTNIEKAAVELGRALESVEQAKKLVHGLIAIMKVLRPISFKGSVNVDYAFLGKEIIRDEFGGDLATLNLSIGDLIAHMTELEEPGFVLPNTVGLPTPDVVWRKCFALEGIQFESRGTRANYVMALDKDGRYVYDPDKGIQYLKINADGVKGEDAAVHG